VKVTGEVPKKLKRGSFRSKEECGSEKKQRIKNWEGLICAENWKGVFPR